MKKMISVILSVLLCVSLLASCGTGTDPVKGDKPTIVTTIFPIYDWVRQIAGDKANIVMLLDSGTDLHSYQPTASDLVQISACDLFICVGGESDEWTEDALRSASNDKRVDMNLLEMLGDKVKAEEVKDGMETDHDHEHHEEMEQEDIRDRTLDEFDGDWKSLAPMLEKGELDTYVAHEAEEEGVKKEEAFKMLSEKWASDAVSIAIKSSQITFTYADGTTATGEYTYAGYTAVQDEDGEITGVRYQFQTDSADAPRYVQFSDHAHEPEEEVEHFHVWFGSESFAALNAASADPFFVSSSLSADDVVEELTEGHDHEEESDEHVWLSLRNAETLCRAIAETLGKLDEMNAAEYTANCEAYVEKLNALDQDYQTAVGAANVKTLLFGDRFPFRYLVDDYGLDYYAAFAGCSAETEASFETIVFLANKADEFGLHAILQIESADGSIAETIRQNTKTKNQTILTLNSMQSVTAQGVAGGAEYLTIMQENLSVLRQALQ